VRVEDDETQTEAREVVADRQAGLAGADHDHVKLFGAVAAARFAVDRFERRAGFDEAAGTRLRLGQADFRFLVGANFGGGCIHSFLRDIVVDDGRRLGGCNRARFGEKPHRSKFRRG